MKKIKMTVDFLEKMITLWESSNSPDKEMMIESFKDTIKELKIKA